MSTRGRWSLLPPSLQLNHKIGREGVGRGEGEHQKTKSVAGCKEVRRWEKAYQRHNIPIVFFSSIRTPVEKENDRLGKLVVNSLVLLQPSPPRPLDPLLHSALDAPQPSSLSISFGSPSPTHLPPRLPTTTTNTSHDIHHQSRESRGQRRLFHLNPREGEGERQDGTKRHRCQ